MGKILTYDPKAAQVIIRTELEFLRDRIAANIMRNGQNASGQTIQSMRVEAGDEEGTLYGRRFFGVLETGRRPGRVPSGFAQIILKWMQAKNIQADDGKDLRMANAIAWAIRKRGSRLFREGGRKDVFSNEIPAARERLKERFSELMTSLTISETEQIRKGYKFT